MNLILNEIPLILVLVVLTNAHQDVKEELPNKPCRKRQFPDGIVCVCNSTYCDTIAPNDRLQPTQYAVYSTTEAGDRLRKTVHSFDQSFTYFNESVFTLNRQIKYQKIIGFGGAFTDAAGINIASLSKSTANRLLDAYFSPQGSEYTLARIPMASCDFSTHVYSYDDPAGDFELLKFSLQMEDYKYKIPYIQKARSLSRREIKLFASPWSAPGWLKVTGKMKGGGPLLGKAGDKYHKVWAMYFVRFLEEYQKHNLTMWAVTAQNEPLTGLLPNYPFQTMAFTAETQADFIAKDLGPALHKHGFENVKLLIMDDQRIALPRWPKTIKNNPEAAKYVSGIAVHWYLDFIYPAYSLTLTHQAVPDWFILYTEACEGYQKVFRPVTIGSWWRLETYVKDIMDDLSNWVSGWTDWNLALDMQGGPNWVKNFVDSPIIVNKEKDEFYKQPMYYALAHFSKFLPADSYRIDLRSNKLKSFTKLKILAFSTPDGSTVVIVSNQGATEEHFQILDPDRGTIHAVAPSKSLLTYVWW